MREEVRQILLSAILSSAISFLILNHEIIAWFFEDIVDKEDVG